MFHFVVSPKKIRTFPGTGGRLVDGFLFSVNRQTEPPTHKAVTLADQGEDIFMNPSLFFYKDLYGASLRPDGTQVWDSFRLLGSVAVF